MGYSSLSECVRDLEATGRLIRIEQEIDPHLEAAEIQRRVYEAGGPAILYSRVRGCRFPMVSNLFGTLERARYLFRDSLSAVRRLVELKVEPAEVFRHPFRYFTTPFDALHMIPRRTHAAPVLQCSATVDDLPKLVSWPRDGGPFITLPIVYTEDPNQPGWKHGNLGMYRVQLSGNQYAPDEVGLHYQIHRGIGVHHATAIRRGEPLRVNVHVGGPPALTLAAVMPLPEGLTEIAFAGVLGRRRVRVCHDVSPTPLLAEADFCLTGFIDPERRLSEGPFGDHLGYYSLQHPFPVMKVERVFHRTDAIWPFTTVGRPPQEDTTFGALIHELTGPVIPTVLPGVRAVHAVDAAGVHPLLLAIGSERYVPYQERERPMELLTQANAILGQGQMSLAKYVCIVADEDKPDLDIHDTRAFFIHLLERIDLERDLHFQTRTTIDTLDYSGTGLNEGSKVVMAAVGLPRRRLPTVVAPELSLPVGFSDARSCLPGVLAVRGPKVHSNDTRRDDAMAAFCNHYSPADSINAFPLIVVVDDSEFVARSWNNFLWVTFTRSNPASDIHGIGAFIQDKHWSCKGSMIIDARAKPHHAPPLEQDPSVTKQVDALAVPGGPLHGIL